MDLIFHIGCEKTGTTSVQAFLHQNEAALRGRGVHYTRALGRPNNRRISFYGLVAGTPDDQLRRDGVTTAEDHAALQTRIADEFEDDVREAKAAGMHTYVISNEHCHSRLKKDEFVQRVHDLVMPHFDRVRIICFLRPQIDMCMSLASTLSRNGGKVGRPWIDRDLRPANPYYRFDELLARWARIFGKETITPVSFKRTPDAVSYFETLLGIADMELPRRPPANLALDYRVIAIINGMSPPDPAERSFDYTLRLFLNELPVDERLSLDRASAQAFQHRFLPANAACVRDWPVIEPADLRPEWKNYPVEGNIDRMNMADEIGPYLRMILDRMRLENSFEKARRLAMTSEREWQHGRLDAALKACRDGMGFAQQAAVVEAYRKPMEQLVKRLETRMARIESGVAAPMEMEQE